MIVVDTSALIAIAIQEPTALECIAALKSEDDVLISAGTLAEALIVASRKGVANDLLSAIQGLQLRVVPVTAALALASVTGYERWGRGVHPAALNFGDCFAYSLAKTYNCPLLFIGNDFSQTDVRSVL